MNERRERIEFELWLYTSYSVEPGSARLQLCDDGSYRDDEIDDRWAGWKARARQPVT